MVGLIILLAAAIALGALIWWGSGLPPTRPRPGSRHRSEPYVSVHRRLENRRKR